MTEVDRVTGPDGLPQYLVTLHRDDFVMDWLDEARWRQIFGEKDTGVVVVPPGVITLRPDNPTGKSVLCYSVFRNESFCFVPWEFGG